MACVVHVLLPIRQKVRDAEVLSPPVCASLCLWNRGRRPVEILVWQTAAFCLANRRLLPGILRPRVPSRLVLGLTYSQLFTFHRVLWRCAATSGARGRHASVLMLCVSGKNIKAGVLRRKKLLKKQLSKKNFYLPLQCEIRLSRRDRCGPSALRRGSCLPARSGDVFPSFSRKEPTLPETSAPFLPTSKGRLPRFQPPPEPGRPVPGRLPAHGLCCPPLNTLRR